MKFSFKAISIDVETYSPEEIVSGKKRPPVGTHKYAAHPDFGILWLAYKRDTDDFATEIDVYNHGIPKWLRRALVSPDVIKFAWNAAFERTTLAAYLGVPMPPEQWNCTMVRAARAGWPLALGACAAAMGLTQQKDKTGSLLISYFCGPCKPTKANGGRTRNLPEHAPEKWVKFGQYCAQDVNTEYAILEYLLPIPISKFEQNLWNIDQQVNDRGFKADREFVTKAIKIFNESAEALRSEANELTGLQNANSTKQLTEWLAQNGHEVENLRKGTVADLVADLKTGNVKRVLQIRQEVNKTSVKKYNAILAGMNLHDDRCCGIFQFGGASRTMRWAGRRIQPQNFPQNHLVAIHIARQLVLEGKIKLLQLMYGNLHDVLSQLIRTAFIPEKGKKLIVYDLSSIELIVAGWLADEQWIIDEFLGERKFYEKTGSRMSGKPVELIGKEDIERQMGKVGTLACQYGGAENAVRNMAANLMITLPEKMYGQVAPLWKAANPNIKAYWWELDRAAKKAIRQPGRVIELDKGVTFMMVRGTLYLRLPSGRMLAYVQAQLRWILPEYAKKIIEELKAKKEKYNVNDYMKETIVYRSMVDGRWMWANTYGPKIFENMCQGVSRDVIAVAFTRLKKYDEIELVSHVHDEGVFEVEDDELVIERSMKRIERAMTKPIKWAPGLPLAAEGFSSYFYRK